MVKYIGTAANITSTFLIKFNSRNTLRLNLIQPLLLGDNSYLESKPYGLLDGLWLHWSKKCGYSCSIPKRMIENTSELVSTSIAWLDSNILNEIRHFSTLVSLKFPVIYTHDLHVSNRIMFRCLILLELSSRPIPTTQEIKLQICNH